MHVHSLCLLLILYFFPCHLFHCSYDKFPCFWIPCPHRMYFLLAFQLFPVLPGQSPSPLLVFFSLDIFFSCSQLAVIITSRYNFQLIIRLFVRLSSTALLILQQRNWAPLLTAGNEEEEEKDEWAVHDQHVLRGLALECCQWGSHWAARDLLNAARQTLKYPATNTYTEHIREPSVSVGLKYLNIKI